MPSLFFPGVGLLLVALALYVLLGSVSASCVAGVQCSALRVRAVMWSVVRFALRAGCRARTY